MNFSQHLQQIQLQTKENSLKAQAEPGVDFLLGKVKHLCVAAAMDNKTWLFFSPTFLAENKLISLTDMYIDGKTVKPYIRDHNGDCRLTYHDANVEYFKFMLEKEGLKVRIGFHDNDFGLGVGSITHKAFTVSWEK